MFHEVKSIMDETSVISHNAISLGKYIYPMILLQAMGE